MPKEYLWFRATGQRTDGATWTFYVYTSGRTIVIRTSNPGSIAHQVSSRNFRTADQVMHEIGIVYNVVKVTTIPDPQLASSVAPHARRRATARRARPPRRLGRRGRRASR